MNSSAIGPLFYVGLCLFALLYPLAARGQASTTETNTVVAIDTDLGRIVIELDVEHAPGTTANYLRYVEAGLFEGGSFYRSVRADNQPDNEFRIQVIQGGINQARREESFEPIPMEGTGTTGLRHLDGTVSMARSGPDTARGEFFICVGDQPELDEGGKRNSDGRGFAAFGRVIEGMDVVRRIHESATDGQSLSSPVRITSARIR